MTSLQQAITDIFGEYEPIERITIQHEVQAIAVSDMDGNETIQTVSYDIPVTEYVFNWSWAAGVVLFMIVLYSFMRMVGTVLKWKI